MKNGIGLPVAWDEFPAIKSIFRYVFGVHIRTGLGRDLRVAVSGIIRYVLKSAGNSCKRLAAANQKFVQGKSQNAKKRPKEKAGKRCQKKNEKSRSDIVTLEIEQCVEWREQRIGATKCDRIEFDEGSKVELYEVSAHLISSH